MNTASRIEIRKNIIKACSVIVAEQGYLSVSFSALEKASKQTKAVLYGYFINKRTLAMAVLDYNLERKRKAPTLLLNHAPAKRKN
jgi:AcrR family transcriptional regulator